MARRLDHSTRTPRTRAAVRGCSAFGALILGSAMVVGASGAAAAAGAPAPTSSAPVAVTDPTAGHPYRHGAVARMLRGHHARAAHARSTNGPDTTGLLNQSAPGTPVRGPLHYNGGPVVTGQPQVYLVFWGSQWGTEGTETIGANTYDTFSGDTAGIAPYLQSFFTGLGNGGETWSGMASQYCEGIALSATTCPLSAAHVVFPASSPGGVLAGVMEDTGATPPTGPPFDSSTTAIPGVSIAAEAANAATVEGNSSANAQYVIVSPPGTNPDNWADPFNGFCAYHDFTADPYWGLGGVPDVAYTNLPYIPDAGVDCGQDYVTSGSGGDLDGVGIVEGHEFTEALTDPFPAGGSYGWLDASKNANEIADKCAWLNPGQTGAATDISLPTGSFAVQGMWANDANKGHGGCETAHSPIYVAAPAKRQTTVAGSAAVPVQVSALDTVPGAVLTYSAPGLPAGVSIDPVSGQITGTPTTPGRSTVTIEVGDGTYLSTPSTFVWIVKRAPKA